jgi:hypothetical protein
MGEEILELPEIETKILITHLIVLRAGIIIATTQVGQHQIVILAGELIIHLTVTQMTITLAGELLTQLKIIPTIIILVGELLAQLTIIPMIIILVRELLTQLTIRN